MREHEDNDGRVAQDGGHTGASRLTKTRIEIESEIENNLFILIKSSSPSKL